MEKKYKDIEEVFELVRSFEDATISHNEWKHAEHLVVALFYLSHHDLETATAKMRDGILNLLVNGFKVNLKKEMPYHETLTVFWMRTVADFNAEMNGSSMLKKANSLAEIFDKDYPLKFYSRELLFSAEARKRMIEADIRQFIKVAPSQIE